MLALLVNAAVYQLQLEAKLKPEIITLSTFTSLSRTSPSMYHRCGFLAYSLTCTLTNTSTSAPPPKPNSPCAREPRRSQKTLCILSGSTSQATSPTLSSHQPIDPRVAALFTNPASAQFCVELAATAPLYSRTLARALETMLNDSTSVVYRLQKAGAGVQGGEIVQAVRAAFAQADDTGVAHGMMETAFVDAVSGFTLR